MANGGIPSYLASAKPNPVGNRAPWYTNTAQSYAGIFLWIAFFDQLAKPLEDASGKIIRDGTLASAGLGMCLLGLLLAGLLAVFLFYYVPGLLGMRTGLPLYIVGTSTFGTKGGYFLPGIFMGLLQIGWYSVATFYAAKLVLEGVGLGNYVTTILDPSKKTSPLLFAGTAIAWGYLFAFIGALGIKYVAKVATFFPIVPITMLVIAAVAAAPHVGTYKPAADAPAQGVLLTIQLVIGFFATAGAVGADFCTNNRDERDVRWGGIVGICLPILFAGGLGLVTVAGAHGKAVGLASFEFNAALPVVSPGLGRIMQILFAVGSIAPACFCSFIIGNSLSTMLGSEKTRVPLTLGGATIGIILAVLGVAGNLSPFFQLIGASFGPVIGAMMADYVRNGGKWAGPRAGISIPGYTAWVLGFLVGILGHGWVQVLPDWHITSVYSLIVGFVVYYVLATIGLEPKKVDVPGLQQS